MTRVITIKDQGTTAGLRTIRDPFPVGQARHPVLIKEDRTMGLFQEAVSSQALAETMDSNILLNQASPLTTIVIIVIMAATILITVIPIIILTNSTIIITTFNVGQLLYQNQAAVEARPMKL